MFQQEAIVYSHTRIYIISHILIIKFIVLYCSSFTHRLMCLSHDFYAHLVNYPHGPGCKTLHTYKYIHTILVYKVYSVICAM